MLYLDEGFSSFKELIDAKLVSNGPQNVAYKGLDLPGALHRHMRKIC